MRLCDRGLKSKKRAAVFAAVGGLVIKVDKLRVVHPTNGRHRGYPGYSLLVHGQHLQAMLLAQCRHNAMQRDCLRRLHRNDQELRSAVRAERAQVAQLQRKVELLQALLNEAGEAAWR